MSYGERAALIGLAGQLRPKLAIEIGSSAGGGLLALLPHCEELHSFDLEPPTVDGVADQPKLTLHTGDSHELLPEALAGFSAAGRTVEFALVDGDHSAEGVERDMVDLLGSDAVSDTVILAHDAANGEVRRGLEAVDLGAYPKVAFVDLDFVSGSIVRHGAFAEEMWGGLALILVDGRRTDGSDPPFHQTRYSAFELLSEAWHQRMTSGERRVSTAQAATLGSRIPTLETKVAGLARELALYRREAERLSGELASAHEQLASVQSSVSWRLTAPLRALKRRVRERREGLG